LSICLLGEPKVAIYKLARGSHQSKTDGLANHAIFWTLGLASEARYGNMSRVSY
jgi:hypothetical protein